MPLLLLLLQVDPRLVPEDWKAEPHWADTRDKPFYVARGDDGGDGEISTFHWDSQGRIRFDREDASPRVWMGYRLLTIASDADLDRLDHDFTDLALALAARPGLAGVTVAAGAGTANDGLFAESSTWYGLGLAEWSSDSLRAGLSYDGNRSLWNGVPLPYVSWIADPRPDLHLRLGTLETTLRWAPSEAFSVAARWSFPGDGSLRIESGLGEGFALFAEGARRVDGFHERDRDRTRLFYAINTAETGLRWRSPWGDLSLSVGWAFGQRWSEGTGLDELDTVAAPEDRPFAALTVVGLF